MRKSRKNYKTTLYAMGFGLLFTVTATAGESPKLTFTFTKANIRGALETQINGVNNAGVTVGSYQDKSSEHGYI